MTTDAELLEKWRTELPPIDANLLLKELISRHILSTSRVEMAAALGSPVAIFYMGVAASSGEPAVVAYTQRHLPLPEHYRTKIKTALVPLDGNEKLRFAYDCAARVQEFWIQAVPADESVRAAMNMARNCIGGGLCTLEELDAFRRQLQTARDDFDDPAKEIYKFPRLVAAAQSLLSVASLIGAVRIAEKIRMGHPTSSLESLDGYCSYAARYAVIAATEHAHNNFQTKASEAQWLVEKAEECWQIQRLFNYLLKRIE